MSRPPVLRLYHDELLIDSFAGGGGASLGMKVGLGREPDIAINHDREAIAMHAANHPRTKHYCEDIWKMDPREACGSRPVGLAWFSPDCFPAGTMVLTREGYRPIEEVAVGDEVLTHQLRWRRVTDTMRTVRPLVRLRGHGHPGLLVSAEHPFYARRRRDVWNNERRGYDRTLEPADWVVASSLDRGWYWASPTVFPPSEPPPVPAYRLRETTVDARLMWVAGRYVADGWTRLTDTRAELVISCGHHKTDALREMLSAWPRAGSRSGSNEIVWHERDTKTAHQFATNHRGLVEWLREHFGHGAAEKTIPGWALGMDRTLRESLLAGYLAGDGYIAEYVVGNKLVSGSTVSKALAFGLKALVTSLGYSPAVYLTENPNTLIEGRVVNARPAWTVRWRDPLDEAHRQTFREDGREWAPIREQQDPGASSEVFNLSVSEDESFVADGIIVHNCTHFSRAKGTQPVKKQIRGLAWVVLLWAKLVRPRVIGLENVEEFEDCGPLLENGMPDPARRGLTFRIWKGKLEALGYKVEYRELVAAGFGAATTRNRL